jgi:hypothetical protein
MAREQHVQAPRKTLWLGLRHSWLQARMGRAGRWLGPLFLCSLPASSGFWLKQALTEPVRH